MLLFCLFVCFLFFFLASRKHLFVFLERLKAFNSENSMTNYTIEPEVEHAK